MINGNTANGKLHLILEILGRQDLRDLLTNELSISAQEELFQALSTELENNIELTIKQTIPRTSDTFH